MTAAQDSRAQFEDGAWYWVEKEGWIGDPPTIVPACYKAECDAWYSFAFSGIPTREVKVLEPCRRAALCAELTEEREATDNWRRLALQFDGHRMQALWHLRAIASAQNSLPARISAAEDFLSEPPLSGEQVLAERIAALAAAAPQPAAQADIGFPISNGNQQVAPQERKPLTYAQIISAWNAQADEQNQWDDLGEDEKIEFAMKCAHGITGEAA